MPAKKRASKRSFVDADEAPAWTAEQFARAEVAFGDKVVRAAQGTLTRPRGRPKKADAKVHIHIRLSPQVLGYFRATGPGGRRASTRCCASGWRRRAGQSEPLDLDPAASLRAGPSTHAALNDRTLMAGALPRARAMTVDLSAEEWAHVRSAHEQTSAPRDPPDTNSRYALPPTPCKLVSGGRSA